MHTQCPPRSQGGSYDSSLLIDRDFEVRAGKMVRSVVHEGDEIEKKLKKLGLEAELERRRIIGRTYVLYDVS